MSSTNLFFIFLYHYWLTSYFMVYNNYHWVHLPRLLNVC